MYLAMQGKPHKMAIGAREIGQWLALPDALAEDKVKPLSSALDQAALAQHLSDTAVTRILLPKDILRSDAQGEATGADDFNATRVLADEHRPAAAIVAVTYCIQQSFPNRAIVEGRDTPDKQSLLEVLKVVTQVDETPDLIEHRQNRKSA